METVKKMPEILQEKFSSKADLDNLLNVDRKIDIITFIYSILSSTLRKFSDSFFYENCFHEKNK